MGTLVSFLITNTSFIHQLFCGNVKFQDSLILVPSTKSVIICMELITDLVDETKIIESCTFVIPTKELMDKASICERKLTNVPKLSNLLAFLNRPLPPSH